jgi:hypothetical protein
MSSINPLARRTDPATSHEAAPIWKKIPGHTKYSANQFGEIRRDERAGNAMPGICKQYLYQVNGRGGRYWRVSVTCDEGRHKSLMSHALIALAWIGLRPEGMVTRHLDGDSENNNASNLAYGTYTQNVHDAIEHGSQVRGIKQHLAKLGEIEVRQLKLKFLSGQGFAELGLIYGVNRTTCLDIVSGRTWGHVEPSGDLRALVEKKKYGYRGGIKTSSHVGVSFASKKKVWVARRRANGKPVCLGEFKTEAQAVQAVTQYDLKKAEQAETTGELVPTTSGRYQRVWRAL